MSPHPKFPEVVPAIVVGDLLLRAPTEDDVPAWFARATDVESAALAGDPIPQSIALGAQWLARHRQRFAERRGIQWAIVCRRTSENLGGIGLNFTSPEQRVADLGMVVARAHWGQGIATAAARIVIGYAFEVLDLVEVRTEIIDANRASRRVLEKLGFRFEGVVPPDPATYGDDEEGYVYVLTRGS